jgi:hypothetical protein
MEDGLTVWDKWHNRTMPIQVMFLEFIHGVVKLRASRFFAGESFNGQWAMLPDTYTGQYSTLDTGIEQS